MNALDADMGGVDLSRRLTTLRQKKKQATLDGQLLINRIALLQKEEERARKKIVETTEKASEVLHMREQNVGRLKQWDVLTSEDLRKKKETQLRVKKQEEQDRASRSRRVQSIHEKRWQSVLEVKSEKEKIVACVVEDSKKVLEIKKKKREEVRAQQEQARLKRERDRLESERKIKEYHEKLLQEEMEEAHRAELLVRDLEKKEQEWISRLRTTQTIQETAFEHLEAALLLDDSIGGGASPHLRAIRDRAPLHHPSGVGSGGSKERSPSAPASSRRSSSSVDVRKRVGSGAGTKHAKMF